MNNISLWDTIDFEENRKESFVEFPYDPLASVCACIRLGKPVWDFAQTLELYNKFPTLVDLVILQEDIDLAKKIRTYFKHKYLVWILKNPGREPSKYRRDMYSFLENDNRVNRDHFRIMSTLPRFYEEDKSTLKLFENYQSLNEKYNNGDVVTIDAPYEYVGKIDRNCSKTNSTRYYFCDRKKQLLMKEIPNSDSGKNLMDYIVNNEKFLNINGTATAKSQLGFDFRLFHLNNFELIGK